MTTTCALCNAPADLRCTGCGLVHYCDKHHQRADWQRHKQHCVAVRVECNATMGRFVVATRRIRAGSVIVKKAPLVAGPKMRTAPICLGCHRTLSAHCVRCSRCAWHMCGADCEQSVWHQAECVALAAARISPDTLQPDVKNVHYSIILPLRAMLLQRKRYEQLMCLQSHVDENMAKPIYAYLEKTLLPLMRRLRVPDANALLQVCAIFDTNAFEVRNASSHVDIRAIYPPPISFIAHSCAPNTRHVCDEQLAMSVIAMRDIDAGELITTTYTQLLWSTLRRRAHLKRNKYFDCECRRCADPTEMRTFIGSIRCQRCARGLLVSTQPLDADAGWECNHCTDPVSAHQIHTIDAQIQAEIFAAPTTIASFEQLLRNYSHLLHANNTHMLELKYALLKLYERDASNYQRIVELCQDLLAVTQTLEPASSSLNEMLENTKRTAELQLKTCN